jgi:hypothetical protein
MTNENIIREVDEELRGDRARALWRRFGPWVITAAVLVVLGVGVNEGWRWWQDSNAARSSDQFYAALETAQTGDIAAAQEQLNKVVAEGSGGYPLLARFRQASLLARDGKTAEAVAAYDALVTATTNQRIRELALILAANLLVDSGDVAAVQQRIGGLVDPSNPMRNPAREAIGLTQYKAGQLDAALTTFSEILIDPLASEIMRLRVQTYIGQLVALGANLPEAEATAAETPAVETPAATPTTATPTAATPATTTVPEATATPATTTVPAATTAPTTTTVPAPTTTPTTTATPTTTSVPTTTTAP